MAIQHLLEPRSFNVSTAENHRNFCIGQALPFIQQRSQWGGACAFRDLVGVVKVNSHRVSDRVFRDLHDSRRTTADRFDGLLIRFARGEAIRKG